tara:strand:+ start:1929 stop:2369 length:441 start_codon:yes stop_codon:yes gene_type:complete
MFKIYRIIDNTNGDIYIGQTIQKLYKRLNNHKQDFKRDAFCISKQIIKNGDYKIELIEETDDKSRERYWIENTDCINITIPGRTRKQHYDDTKDKLDKEKLKKYNKEYRSNTNCDKIKYNWYSSMGGSPYKYNNSLLRIDTTIFEN